MSNFHTLQLTVKLNELERNIKNAKVVKFEELPTDQDLAIRKMIEYAKPMKTLDEVVSSEPTKNKHIGSSFDDFIQEEEKSEEFKTSFREVLRLAKSGQQAWWSEDLKNSTNAHIEQMDEYYRQNYSDETID